LKTHRKVLMEWMYQTPNKAKGEQLSLTSYLMRKKENSSSQMLEEMDWNQTSFPNS
jgi:hypothetical protein